MNGAQHVPPEAGCSEREVADYLAGHPEFFETHPELLAAMQLSHPSGAAVSLIERQVQVLRQQHDQAERKLRQLVEVARDNDQLSEKLHGLALALLDCGSLADSASSTLQRLSESFGADMVTLQLFSNRVCGPAADGVLWVDSGQTELTEFENILNSHRPICGRLTARQLDGLFGEHAGRVGSAVVIPLAGEAATFGLLAVGSADDQRFQHGMGTAFLQQLGELTARALARHLEPASAHRTGREAE